MKDIRLSILMFTRHAVTEQARFAAWLGALLESTATTPTYWKNGRKAITSFDRAAVEGVVEDHRTAGRSDVIYLYRKAPPKYELGFSCPDTRLRFVTLDYDKVPAAIHLPDIFAAADRLSSSLDVEFGYADFPWDDREYGPLFPGVMTWKTLNQLGPTVGYRRTYLGSTIRRPAKGKLATPLPATATKIGEILRVDLIAAPWEGNAQGLTSSRIALREANDALGLFRQRRDDGTVTAAPSWKPILS